MSFYKRYRTPMLAVIATLCFVYAAIFVFHVDPAEIGAYFLWSVFGLLILVITAFIVVFAVKTIKSLLDRK